MWYNWFLLKNANKYVYIFFPSICYQATCKDKYKMNYQKRLIKFHDIQILTTFSEA